MHDDELMRMTGYDNCIAGVVCRFGQEPIICYDQAKVLAKLVNEDGMTEVEAVEFWEFNQLGAWHGDRTPCFLIELQEDLC